MRLLSLISILGFSFMAQASTSFDCIPDKVTARRNKEISATVLLNQNRRVLFFTSHGENGRPVIGKTRFTRTEWDVKFTADEGGRLTDEGDAFALADQNMLDGKDGILKVDVEAYDIGKMLLVYGDYECSVSPGSK